MNPEPVAPSSPVSGTVESIPPKCIPLAVVKPPKNISPGIMLSAPVITILAPVNTEPVEKALSAAILLFIS